MKTWSLLIFQAFIFTAYAQEHASIVKQSSTYTIKDNQTAEIEEVCTMKIISEKGNSHGLYRQFIDRFTKLTDISLDVYDKNGQRVKKMRRSDGHEFGFNESYEISDGKVFVLDPDYKEYPYTIEVKSTIKLNGFTSLPVWVPRSYFNVSVAEANFTIVYPENLLIKFKEENITGQQSNEQGKIIRRYMVKDLPAVQSRIRYKDFYKDQIKVFVCPENFQLDGVSGSNRSWQDFGEWFLKLNSDPYVLSENTKSFINSIDKTNKPLLVEKIYEYMQDRTRYVSIQLGIGGFKSLPTADVEKYGYGDCKALSTYTKNMLDYAGIKSNYVLVKAGEDVPELLSDFPSSQFNHVYIGVPLDRDTIYLECTSQINPVNHTGTFTDDRYVLWIEKGKSSLIRSRIYQHTANVRTSKIHVELDKEGNSMLKYSVDNQGIFFDEVMLYKMAPTDYVKRYNEGKFDFDNFTIKDFKYNQQSRNVPFFTAQFVIEVSNFAKLVNGKLILSTHTLSPAHKYVDSDELMNYFYVPRAITLIDEITVSIPENFWIGNLPQPEKIVSLYGSFETSIEANSNTLIIKKTLVLKKGNYTKDGHIAFKQFYDQVDKSQKRKLILNSRT